MQVVIWGQSEFSLKINLLLSQYIDFFFFQYNIAAMATISSTALVVKGSAFWLLDEYSNLQN